MLYARWTKRDEENPKTRDNIGLSFVFLGSISLIELLGCEFYLNRKKKIN